MHTLAHTYTGTQSTVDTHSAASDGLAVTLQIQSLHRHPGTRDPQLQPQNTERYPHLLSSRNPLVGRGISAHIHCPQEKDKQPQTKPTCTSETPASPPRWWQQEEEQLSGPGSSKWEEGKEDSFPEHHTRTLPPPLGQELRATQAPLLPGFHDLFISLSLCIPLYS